MLAASDWYLMLRLNQRRGLVLKQRDRRKSKNVRKIEMEDEEEVECVRMYGKERRTEMKRGNEERVLAQACVRGSWGL